MEVYCPDREAWRGWLSKNHSTSEGVWLIYYKKPSGKARVPYDAAVEEALCFGWIDGKIKRINEEYYQQWFAPRRKGSRWSVLNVNRVRKLIGEGRMEAPGLASFREAIEKPELIYDLSTVTTPELPEDLLEGLKENRVAFDNFMNFTEASRRMYLLWLESAKRQETRSKRIATIISRSEKNEKPGMM